MKLFIAAAVNISLADTSSSLRFTRRPTRLSAKISTALSVREHPDMFRTFIFDTTFGKMTTESVSKKKKNIFHNILNVYGKREIKKISSPIFSNIYQFHVSKVTRLFTFKLISFHEEYLEYLCDQVSLHLAK